MTSAANHCDPWRPVLTGTYRDTALRVISRIVDSLSAANRTVARRDDPLIAILFAEASRALNRPALMECAARQITDVADSNRSKEVFVGLHGGACAIGWTISWLEAEFPNEASRCPIPTRLSADWCRGLDASVAHLLDAWDSTRNSYDLISGLVGIGLYGAQRQRIGISTEIPNRVFSLLLADCRQMSAGIAWKTPPNQVPSRMRNTIGDGLFNLGVAHGAAGVLAFLAHLHAVKPTNDEVVSMAESIVTWLASQQLSFGDGARMPHWIVPGREAAAGRMAWCYGGLGMSVALMVASRAFEKPAWERTAHEWAQAESARQFEQSYVADACLCHGAAGNAFLFQRLYCATGSEHFRAASVEWFERALGMYQDGRGQSGYLFSDGPVEVDNCAFLTGAAGVALALIASIADAGPTWDRIILTDIPAARLGTHE